MKYLFYLLIVPALALFTLGVAHRPTLIEELVALFGGGESELIGAVYAGESPTEAESTPTDGEIQLVSWMDESPGGGVHVLPPEEETPSNAFDLYGAPPAAKPVWQRDSAPSPPNTPSPLLAQPTPIADTAAPSVHVRPLPVFDPAVMPTVAIDPARLPTYPSTADGPEQLLANGRPTEAPYFDAPLYPSTAPNATPTGRPDQAPYAPAGERFAARDGLPPRGNPVDAASYQTPTDEARPYGPPSGMGGHYAGDAPAAAINRPVVAELVPIESATQLARVGDDIILGSEVLHSAHQAAESYLEEMLKQAPPRERETLTDAKREEMLGTLTQQFVKIALPSRIQTKMVYLDAVRTLPPEALEQWLAAIDKSFEDEVIPAMIQDLGMPSRSAFEEELRRGGSSIAAMRRVFGENQIATSWEMEQAKSDYNVAVDDLLDYYHEHIDEFETPAAARWEQLTVKCDSTSPRQEADARAKLAAMGNAIRRGAPFEEVAKRDSDGPTAGSGGVRSWTNHGSLKSNVLDGAIFSLPVGAMSRILRDEDGFHIIRVIERHDLVRESFEEAQLAIAKKLREKYKEETLAEYRKRLQKEIPVTTIFDEQTAGVPREPVVR